VIEDYALDPFVKLFAGRDDVYGSNEGGCVKSRLDGTVLQNHFNGTAPIGIYPVVPRDGLCYVGWGCVDFDTTEAQDHATKLYDALMEAGVQSWIERSRSKGYHVWVFADRPVLATLMRQMLIVACHVAEVPTTEVNPKQTTLAKGSYGNYVRLPYAGILEDAYTDKQRIIERDHVNYHMPHPPMPFMDFVTLANASRVSSETIAHISSMYQPPVKQTAIGVVAYDATLDEAMQLLSPLGKVIWRDGPLTGKDRSSTLAKLGHETVRSGLNPSQTKIVLRTADQRWGKYHLRHDGDLEIDKLVVRVHS